MAISPFASRPFSLQGVDFAAMRRDLQGLQRQLASGQKAATYGGLGFERRTSLDARAKLSALEGYRAAIGQADLRLKLMLQNLERMAKLGSETKSDLTLSKFELLADGRTFAQKNAEQRLRETIDLLNADLSGRALFAGRAVDGLPVESYDIILNGDGTRAGLKALIAERTEAERGADGLGRLEIARTGASVRVANEADGLPFGFKVAGVSSTGGRIAAAADPGPPAAAVVTVAAEPQPGDTVTLTLTDPDGAVHTIALTARAAVAPGEAKTSFLIGADAAATAQNLHEALEAAVRDKVSTALLPRAAIRTSDAFFAAPATLPDRVAGPPFATATALVAGTPETVVVWYKGDADAAVAARDTAPVRIDASQVVATGARANEPAIRNLLAQLGVLAAESFADTRADADRYAALTEQVFNRLADRPGNPKVADIATELATASATMQAAKDRHRASEAMLRDALDGVELANPEETAAAILALQTRLQAAYETTAILSRLTLVNYL